MLTLNLNSGAARVVMFLSWTCKKVVLSRLRFSKGISQIRFGRHLDILVGFFFFILNSEKGANDYSPVFVSSTKRYPTPWTVRMWRGWAGSASKRWRNSAMWLSIVRVVGYTS